MNLSRVGVVLRKELTDAFRDRRSIYSMLVGALVGPILVGFIFNRIAVQQRGAQEIRVPVTGRANAPLLVDWLGQQVGVQVVDGPDDAEGAVRESKEDFVLLIPKEFGEKFRESRPATVKLVSDGTRQSARSKVQRVRSLLQRYSIEVGSLRLITRGVSPSIASALAVEDVEVSSSQQRAAMILNMIPMFVVLAAFIAGMQISTDSTAGERERGSLEPLLVNPAPRIEVVMGKWLAAVTSSGGGMIITLVLTTTVLLMVPLQDLNIRFRFGWNEALALMAGTLPMALMAPAIQMYLSTYARSFKEAQGYMGFLVFVPMMPGMVSAFYPISNRPWLAPVPVLGQYALANDVLGGKQPAAIWFVAGALAAVAVAAVFVWLTTRLFGREKIIFGR